MGRGKRWRLLPAVALVILVWWWWQNSIPTYYLEEIEPRNVPVIFIAGVEGSGLNLMRAILQAHPNIHCGQLSRVSNDILRFGYIWNNHVYKLIEGGVNRTVLSNAIAAFYLEVSGWSRDPKMTFCNKDQIMKEKGSYLAELFPKAKFLFMVRDGRATVHSLISREMTLHGGMLRNYQQGLKLWNVTMTLIHLKCKELGREKCMMVHYETLVLKPRATIQRVLVFLGLPWDEEVLHHERHINSSSPTAEQLMRPINQDSLDKWVEEIPRKLRVNIAQLASMLTVLGYDPKAYPPRYEELRTFDLITEPPEPKATVETKRVIL